MDLTGLCVTAVFIVFMLLLIIANRISKSLEPVLIGCKIHYSTNIVVALYYNKNKHKYYEVRYDISLWPIRKGHPIKFDLFLNGLLVSSKELRSSVLQYIKSNPPC